MTSRVYSISIDSRNYSAAFQTESQYSAAWDKALSHAHENKLKCAAAVWGEARSCWRRRNTRIAMGWLAMASRDRSMPQTVLPFLVA